MQTTCGQRRRGRRGGAEGCVWRVKGEMCGLLDAWALVVGDMGARGTQEARSAPRPKSLRSLHEGQHRIYTSDLAAERLAEPGGQLVLGVWFDPHACVRIELLSIPQHTPFTSTDTIRLGPES